jgi:hypothetical protein
MTAMSNVVSILAISVGLSLSGSQVLARTVGPGPAKTVGPGQVKTSGTSADPSGAGGNRSRDVPYCKLHPGWGGCPPKADQPPCRGPHRGPNGVMIQCD